MDRVDVLHDDVVSVALVVLERSPGEPCGGGSPGRDLATELLVACSMAELAGELTAEFAS